MSQKQREKRARIKDQKLKPKQERERIFRQLYKDFYPEYSNQAETLSMEGIERNVSGRISAVLNFLKHALRGSTPILDLNNFNTNESHTVAEWEFYWNLNQHLDPKREAATANLDYQTLPIVLEYFKVKSFIRYVKEKGELGLITDKDNILLSKFLDCLRD